MSDFFAIVSLSVTENVSNLRSMVLDTFTFADPARTLDLNPSEVERLHATATPASSSRPCRGFMLFPNRGDHAVDPTRSQLVGPGAFGRGLHGAQFLWGWRKGLHVVLDAHDHYTGFAPAADYKTFIFLGGPPDNLPKLGAGARLRRSSVLVMPTRKVSASPDEADNRFLEYAEAARADFLVTGNKKHFPKRWKTTEVVNTRELLGRIGSSFLK